MEFVALLVGVKYAYITSFRSPRPVSVLLPARAQNGKIEKSELIDALKGMFPVEPRVLEQAINANWGKWDEDGDGVIGRRGLSCLAAFGWDCKLPVGHEVSAAEGCCLRDCQPECKI